MVTLASTIAEAFKPATPGKAVQLLSPILPGVARTKDQIADYQQYWRELAEHALADPDQPTLVVLGDSLAQGIGASTPELGYPQQVADALGIDAIVNLSRSGARVADVRTIQIPALHAAAFRNPTIVCTVASNDLLGLPPRPASLISGLLADLPQIATVATIPDVGSLMAKRVNRALRSQAAESGHPIADLAAHLQSWSGIQAGDRFHPNDDGYQLWVEAFVNVLAPAAAA